MVMVMVQNLEIKTSIFFILVAVVFYRFIFIEFVVNVIIPLIIKKRF